MENKQNKNPHKSKYKIKNEREIDILTGNFISVWSEKFVFIKKARVRTWKGALILSFIAGLVAATIWMVAVNLQTKSGAAGETAILSLEAETETEAEIKELTVGESAKVNIMLNTNANNVVAVKAVVNYNKEELKLIGWNTAESSFAVLGNNECMQANQGNPCEIISDTPENGSISITISKPTPGINSDSATVASLVFEALKKTEGSIISLAYTSQGSYDDSDVILDDATGKDILTAVVPETIIINNPACTSFTYGEWGNCTYDSHKGGYFQIRSVISKVPADCDGNPPEEEVAQSCPAPACLNVTATEWSECARDPEQTEPTKGKQIRSLVVSPEKCSLQNSEEWPTERQCDLPVCSYNYGSWSECLPDKESVENQNSLNGIRTRTAELNEDADYCYVASGDPKTSEYCQVASNTKACAQVSYGEWGACQDNPSSSEYNEGLQTRTVTVEPEGCTISSQDAQPIQRSCEAPACQYAYGEWSACQANGTKTREISIEDTFCTPNNPEPSSEACDYQEPVLLTPTPTPSPAPATLTQDDDEEEEEKDKKKPKISIPSYLTKNRGDKIWWKGTDNEKISHYRVTFGGKKKVKTKRQHIYVPMDMSRGIHILKIKAYDKAGNTKTKTVTIRVK